MNLLLILLLDLVASVTAGVMTGRCSYQYSPYAQSFRRSEAIITGVTTFIMCFVVILLLGEVVQAIKLLIRLF